MICPVMPAAQKQLKSKKMATHFDTEDLEYGEPRSSKEQAHVRKRSIIVR